jgi:hypothetical protein
MGQSVHPFEPGASSSAAPSAALGDNADESARELGLRSFRRVRLRRLGIMGAGGAATSYEANPWLTRIREHTQALLGWTFIHRINFKRGDASISDRQRRLLARDQAQGSERPRFGYARRAGNSCPRRFTAIGPQPPASKSN